MAQATQQQTEAHHPVQNNHHGGIHRVAGNRQRPRPLKESLTPPALLRSPSPPARDQAERLTDAMPPPRHDAQQSAPHHQRHSHQHHPIVPVPGPGKKPAPAPPQWYPAVPAAPNSLGPDGSTGPPTGEYHQHTTDVARCVPEARRWFLPQRTASAIQGISAAGICSGKSPLMEFIYSAVQR